MGAILLLASISTAAGEPRRVLLLDSFEKGGPSDGFKTAFLKELKKESPEPLALYELSVGPGSLAGDGDDRPLLNYLHSAFKDQRLDLIVTIAGTAARFAQRNRDQLFPSTPLVFTTVDERIIGNTVTPNSIAVASRVDPPFVIETMLRVLPQMKNVAVVLGRSPLEQFWREELGREFKRFENQLVFTWFDNLSFAEMLNRSATLPANSAIFYVLLSTDAKGITRSETNVITEFRAKANAPIFGLRTPVGEGIVGGTLYNAEELGRSTATIALNLFKGEAPESIKVPQKPERAVFDWRELRRWNIDENRVPPGSIIRFRSQTAWDEYKWYVFAGGALVVFEAVLVVGLAVNVLKRKRVERSLREAEKLVIHAQEAEQSRFAELERQTLQLRRLASQLTLAEQNARQQLARTLHDGLQQQLFTARLALDRVLKSDSQDGHGDLLLKARAEINEATEAARTLSVNLFPPVLHVGGLPVALSWLAKRTQEQYGVVVSVTADPQANPTASDTRIMLFEAVSELLFNAVKHSHVDRVNVDLAVGPDDTIHIQVSDEGVGFDPAVTLHQEDRHKLGLGLFSIRERLALLGGNLDIQSSSGKGARFNLTLPRTDLSRLATDGEEAQHPDTGWLKRPVYDPTRRTAKLRILIADDHAVVRAGLRELLSERLDEFQVVGEAANGVEAISQVKVLQPDLILMDISMPQMNGIEATREIHRTLPHIRIVGLSTYSDETTELSIREAGAQAYFSKAESSDRLIDYLISLRPQAKAASGI